MNINKRFFVSLLSLILFLFMSACNNSSSQSSADNSTTDMKNHPGKNVYDKFCMSCHQTNGSGVPGLYPPIAETKMVNGDSKELIDIILNGMSGEIEVKGEIYNNVMPAHRHLTDQQVADLLTYVKNSFGNDGGSVSVEEVAEVRSKTTP